MFTFSIRPSICGWKVVLNFNLVHVFFINSVQNFDMNFTSRSLTMTFDIPLCRTHMSKHSFAILIAMAFVYVNTNLTNFENLSTTTKMAFIPSHFGRHVIKSIEMLSNGLKGIGKGLYNLNFFLMYQLGTFAFHTHVDIMFYIFLHFEPIESFPKQLPCCFFTIVCRHGHHACLA
jgi:hypothetical protein